MINKYEIAIPKVTKPLSVLFCKY